MPRSTDRSDVRMMASISSRDQIFDMMNSEVGLVEESSST